MGNTIKILLLVYCTHAQIMIGLLILNKICQTISKLKYTRTQWRGIQRTDIIANQFNVTYRWESETTSTNEVIFFYWKKYKDYTSIISAYTHTKCNCLQLEFSIHAILQNHWSDKERKNYTMNIEDPVYVDHTTVSKK